MRKKSNLRNIIYNVVVYYRKFEFSSMKCRIICWVILSTKSVSALMQCTIVRLIIYLPSIFIEAKDSKTFMDRNTLIILIIEA